MKNDRLFIAALILVAAQFIMGAYEITNSLPFFPVHWILEVPAIFLFGLWFKLRGTLSAEKVMQLSLLLNYGFTLMLCFITYCRAKTISHGAFFFSLGVTAMFTTVLYGGYVAGSLGKEAERNN